MRIVHYYPTARVDSGVTIALWAWARAVAATGLEVAVLHGGANPLPDQRLDEGIGVTAEGIREEVVPHRGRGRLTARPVGLGRWLHTDDVLVLHEGWVVSNQVAAVAARRAHVPYLVMPHGVYEPAWRTYLKSPVWLRERMERYLLDRALAVHVFFESEIPDVAHLAPRASFITAPTGFTIPADRWEGGGGYLSWVGRYDPTHKGLDVLVDAMALLPPERRPLLRLHGYDFRGGRAALERRIAELGVGDRVEVGGVITGAEKTDFLRRADGYVHPSRWESYGIALLENLALGVPCLASSTIHLAGDLRRDGAAVLAAPDPRSLADGLVALAAAPSDLGVRGRTLVERRFAWSAVVPEFVMSLEALRAAGRSAGAPISTGSSGSRPR
jgi:glycosyltransferase involved in cell wall biosynthesis